MRSLKGVATLFPSPYGDCGSYQEGRKTNLRMVMYEFPSPYGDCDSYQSVIQKNAHSMPMFPSPYGDYGSYRDVARPIADAEGLFPSPYGDYGSYRSHHHGILRRRFKVSVPLRGLWFLSAPLINGFIAPSKMPFAGRIFFSPHFSHFCGK